MNSFATVSDINALYRPLTPEETERAEALLPVVSDILRQAAYDVNKDLDQMLESGELLKNVAISVTVDVVMRYITTRTDDAPLSQFSQGALGYTFSGTYMVPGGGFYIKRDELKRLNLRQQRMGRIEMV